MKLNILYRIESLVFYLSLLSLSALPVQAEEAYKYRIWFADKAGSEYTVSNPETYLSAASIERRLRQGIDVDSTDFPVSHSYIDAVVACGARQVATSRWLNTLLVALDDTAVAGTIGRLPFVTKVECVWRASTTPSLLSRRKLAMRNQAAPDEYADSYRQISMLRIDSLHAAGFRGDGIDIAVIDLGFYDVDVNPTIDQNRIAGTHDFVHGTFSYNAGKHGAQVLSCMLSNDPGNYIGSAPEATYWLLVSEDDDSEYPVEEDYWVAAVEWADSAGVDIVNTSLGYFTFDDPSMDYTWDDLDGKTAFSSRAASMAASKGMLLLLAAGNEGSGEWRKITVPADAHGVLAVGAVTSDGNRASFSGIGNSADGRIKPEVMALGSSARMIIDGHTVISASGTSFATPILCGGVACLWQARPEWSVAELREAVIRSASQYNTPDCYLGYGIPNLYAALDAHGSIDSEAFSQPLPSMRYAGGQFLFPSPIERETLLVLYDSVGRLVHLCRLPQGASTALTPALSEGLYVAVLSDGTSRTVHKIVVTP